ncbi:hypothetical protein C8R46DRAFT_1064845 [Mycena filopes]|nr:hypothetical protein C8R46DRAFT_1064845 [Mycena filopes]
MLLLVLCCVVSGNAEAPRPLLRHSSPSRVVVYLESSAVSSHASVIISHGGWMPARLGMRIRECIDVGVLRLLSASLEHPMSMVLTGGSSAGSHSSSSCLGAAALHCRGARGGGFGHRHCGYTLVRCTARRCISSYLPYCPPIPSFLLLLSSPSIRVLRTQLTNLPRTSPASPSAHPASHT